MNFKNIFPFCIFLLMLFLFSCNKYLQEKSDKSLVVPKTVDDLQALLDDNNTMNTFTAGFGETSADDYFDRLSDYNTLEPFEQQAYTWRLENYYYGNDWNYEYNAIYTSNYCLDQIATAARTNQNQSKWDNVKGSALFFRAYYFLDLSWDYARAYDEDSASVLPGIVLRLNSDFNVPSVRASIRACYDQVIKDLMEANKYLPDQPQDRMRPSKVAAYGVLARTYLSMRIYDSAFRYSVLALGLQNKLLDYNSPDVSPGADVPFQPYNKEIIFYSSQSDNYYSKSYFVGVVDTLLYKSYDSNDLRKTVFFIPNDTNYSFKGSYVADGYYYFTGIATDELWLIKAECEARLNNVTGALSDLNTLLLNRWITGTFSPVMAGNATDALAKILIERRKELLMRGLRWIDIKRLNKENYNINLTRIVGSDTYFLPANDKRFALAIPADVIAQTGIPQN